ncbi:MAG: GYD domain-containing protein [Desulfobacterales bacterium]|nr:MAG: GYD domain-containing protein [Desulfobacterales bacterium]
MQAYVTLYTYTGPVKGGGPDRFEKVKQIVGDEQGKILYIYGLLGAYDAMSVAEFPDNRSAMRAAVRVGNLINAQTNTLAAVEGEDFLQILSEV